jgi:hypothetical protein
MLQQKMRVWVGHERKVPVLQHSLRQESRKNGVDVGMSGTRMLSLVSAYHPRACLRSPRCVRSLPAPVCEKRLRQPSTVQDVHCVGGPSHQESRSRARSLMWKQWCVEWLRE